MNDMKKPYKDIIKQNEKSISSAAYVQHLKAASEAPAFTIDADGELDRITLVLSVAYMFNAEEQLKELQDQTVLLNQFRSKHGCKPQGFDALTSELKGDLLYHLIKIGFGYYQLRELGYLFDLNDLERHDLIDLRK